MTDTAPELPELLTADDPRVRECTAGGVDHDWRTYRRPKPGARPSGSASWFFIPNPPADGQAPTAAEITAATPVDITPYVAAEVKVETYLRCVWCHAVTCGGADETDPCIEPYHHRVPHRTRMGVTWPIGGNRP